MQQVDIRFCWFDQQGNRDLALPGYASAQAAGMDVAAAICEDVILQPGERILIPTGFGVALPDGYELQVRPRSGLAVKHGVTVINAPGTIDADYRGEVRIGLVNVGREPYTIKRGDRIAQLVLAPVCRAMLLISDRLDETERGSGGFGHTGI